MLKLLDNLRMSAMGPRGDDHPLAHPKEAEAVFAELRGGDPVKSLEEITHWLESVTAADNLRADRRFDLVKRLDETGQPHRIKISRDYAGLSRQARRCRKTNCGRSATISGCAAAMPTTP